MQIGLCGGRASVCEPDRFQKPKGHQQLVGNPGDRHPRAACAAWVEPRRTTHWQSGGGNSVPLPCSSSCRSLRSCHCVCAAFCELPKDNDNDVSVKRAERAPLQQQQHAQGGCAMAWRYMVTRASFWSRTSSKRRFSVALTVAGSLALMCSLRQVKTTTRGAFLWIPAISHARPSRALEQLCRKRKPASQ